MRSILSAGLAFLVLSASASAQPAASPAPKALLFELRVPADAVVLIEGDKTQAVGEIRAFQTQAVPTGKKYSYSIKVTSKGKDVTKDIVLKHDAPNVLDVRPDFLASTTTKPAETKPAEDKKPDDKKPTDEKKPDDKKPADEKKPDDKKPTDEKKSEEKKPDAKPEDKPKEQ